MSEIKGAMEMESEGWHDTEEYVESDRVCSVCVTRSLGEWVMCVWR